MAKAASGGESEAQGADGQQPKGIDEATLTVLKKQIKQGKARKFVVVYKGAKVLKMVAFRKGTFNAVIQKARKEGIRGDEICGMAVGSGMTLSFRIAGSKDVSRALGVSSVYDKPPLKKDLLRKFMAANQYKCKPDFEIVKSVEQLEAPAKGK